MQSTLFMRYVLFNYNADLYLDAKQGNQNVWAKGICVVTSNGLDCKHLYDYEYFTI